MYDLGARVLLRGTVRQSAPVLMNGERQWVTFEEPDYDDSAFPPVKAAFEASGAVRVGQGGSAPARLMRQRDLVNFAVRFWQAP
ncbi:AAC(3) family N-acetyltransferase [Deinococcus aluminii]|uniref:Aminoglycoside N(3)-acetyltransferase n=1 Tax=Deinococcus aluminii TaxID=1656885 RepID=A0ABP9XGA3_9DEIO